jgi:hypothetical protein
VSDKIPLVMTEPAVHVTGLEPTDGGSSTQPSTVRKTDVTVILSDPGRHSSASLHLVNEGTSGIEWHFELPDGVTAAALHDSLLRRLDALAADQASWPTDVDQAYVYVTQHVLAAVGEAAVPR